MRRRTPRSVAGSRVAMLAMALAAAAGGPASASQSTRAVHPRLVPKPSSRRYVALDELASRLGARVETEEWTGVHRLRRGNRVVAVVPGAAAALVGWKLVELDRAVLVRYGRAYVPRDAVRAIERLFGARAVVRPPKPPTPPKPAAGRYFRRICIDPGHGGKDPGAGRPGYYEKHIVLSTAKLLAEELRRRGFEPVFTRDTDVFIELNDRQAIAARHGADAFVSVHANAIGRSSIHGVEIFYCDGKYSSVDRAAAAARAGRKPQPEDIGGSGGAAYESPLRGTLPAGANQAVLQMLFEEYHRESRELAAVLKSAFTRAGFYVRSVRAAGFRVLRMAESPTVLVEIGFLTNRADRAKLLTESHRRKVARAIADGLEAYRRTLERTNGLSN